MAKAACLEHKPNNTTTPRTSYHYNGDNLVSQIDDVESGGTTNTTLTWDANQQRIKIERGVSRWVSIFDPTAGTPAVLAEVYTPNTSEPDTYTLTFNVREPSGGLLSSFQPTGINIHYYHFDSLGSTVLVTNGSRTVSDSYMYNAWGKALAGGSGLKPYQYVEELGYYTHTSSQGSALDDLMQLGVRLYDPEIGRFTQRDPLICIRRPRPYVYSADNPMEVIDPDGLSDKKYYWNGAIVTTPEECGGRLEDQKKDLTGKVTKKTEKLQSEYDKDMERCYYIGLVCPPAGLACELAAHIKLTKKLKALDKWRKKQLKPLISKL